MGSSGNASGGQYFWLRRLHSLLGIVPIGAFLLEHFWSNSHVFRGPQAFDKMVTDLQAMPLVVFLEIGLIGLPIFFHAALGLVIMYSGANNFLQYNYYRNWMYFLQRVTGVIALVFVAYHVWTTRIEAAITGEVMTFAHLQREMQAVWARWAYGIGIVSAVFHFSNGIATALMTWGITVSRRSQRVTSAACWVFFAAMAAWGLQILWEFV